MTRALVALFVLALMTPALAQGARWNVQDSRWERSERIRARQLERRERMERIRERVNGEGVHLRLFRDYQLSEGETSEEPVVVIGGSARIDGHCERDVVVIGGSIHLGPTAVVDGDVVSVGGGLTKEPGATVGGSIDETRTPWPRISVDPDWNLRSWWPTASMWFLGIRVSFVLIFAMILTLVAPGWIGNIAGRPAATSGLAGLAAEVLFIPGLVLLVIALIISIVGMVLLPAVPLLLVAFGGLWIAGLAGVAVRVGGALRGGHAPQRASVTDLLIGYAAIVGVTVLGQALAASLGWVSPLAWPVRSLGFFIEYLAWTIGLGAAITSLFSARSGSPPPPIPV